MGEAHKRRGEDLLELNGAFDIIALVPGARLVLHELQLVTIDGVEALLVEHVPVARVRGQHHKRLVGHLRATRGDTEVRVYAYQRQAWRVYRGEAQGRQHRPRVGD